MLALHAAGQIGMQQTLAAAKQAEIDKLGATGTARKTAIDTWLTATLGDDLGKHVAAGIFSARQVEAFEKIMAVVRTQGAHSFSHQHREPDPGQKISDADWERMSFAERRQYADKFQQPAANGAGH